MSSFGLVVAMLLVALFGTEAYVQQVVPRAGRSRVSMEAARINNSVDLDSEKVVTMVDVDKKTVFCRCVCGRVVSLGL